MKKLIEWVRKYLSLIGLTLAVIGMFFTVIYSIPQIEHILDPIFWIGIFLICLGMIIGKNKVNEKRDMKWDKNKEKKSEETLKDEKLDGLVTERSENGEKKFEGTYKNGKKDGLFTWWYENGQKEYEGFYKDGRKISVEEWNEDGSVKE